MTKEAKARVKREGNTAAVIYDRLRSDILSGKLLPGTPLSQLTIAREGGTSRGPVREAMSRLQQDQLVIGFANRRFNVAPFNVADLEAVLILHLVNIAFAARASVPLLTEREVAQLERHCRELEVAVDTDWQAWERAYREFAIVLVGRAGDRVVALIASLIDNIQRYRANLLDPFPRVYAGGAGFRKITEAAHARDGDAAFRYFVELFGRVSSLIIAGAAPMHDTVRLRSNITALTLSGGGGTA